MHIALRPYMTTGIALVGASVIAVAPVTVPPPDVPTVDLVAAEAVAADVELAGLLEELVAAIPKSIQGSVEFVVSTLPQAVLAEIAAGNFAQLVPIAVAVATAWYTVPLSPFIEALAAGLPLPLGTFDGVVQQAYFLSNLPSILITDLLAELAEVVDGDDSPFDLPADLLLTVTEAVQLALGNITSILAAFTPIGALAAPADAAQLLPSGDLAGELVNFVRAVIESPFNAVAGLVDMAEAIPTYLEMIQAAPPREAIGLAANFVNSTYYELIGAFLAPLTVNVPGSLLEWDFLDAAALTLEDIAGDILGFAVLPTQIVEQIGFGASPLEVARIIGANWVLDPFGWVSPTVVALANALPAPFGGVPDFNAPFEQQGLIFGTFANLYKAVAELVMPSQMLAATTTEDETVDAPVELATTEFSGPDVATFDGDSSAATVTLTVDAEVEQGAGGAGDETPDVAPPAEGTETTPDRTADATPVEDEEPTNDAGDESESPNGATDLTDGNMAEPGTPQGDDDAGGDDDGAPTGIDDETTSDGAEGRDAGAAAAGDAGDNEPGDDDAGSTE